jgi:hypothetical protein
MFWFHIAPVVLRWRETRIQGPNLILSREHCSRIEEAID